METNTVVHRDYREPSDENVTDSVQQLVNGGLKLENYQPIRDLEKIKQETSRQLESTHFSTNLEKQLAETVQRNTIASIDTAKDALDVAVNIAGLVNTCRPAIANGSIKADDIVRATGCAQAAFNSLKRIYNRSCDTAVSNSNELLFAIKSSDEHSQIKAIADKHQDDLRRFENGEVSSNVPRESNKQLLESINKCKKLANDSEVREKANKSSSAWDIVYAIGVTLLAVGITLTFAILKR